MEILEAFIRQMREHREARHWTQERAAFECAVSVEHYKKVERGVSTPSLTIAVRMAKRVINEGANLGLRPSIVFDSEAYATTFATEDRITGMTAFLNKTKANFQNR